MPKLTPFILDTESKYGRNSLHQAAYKGHAEIVKLLLAKGASVTAETEVRNDIFASSQHFNSSRPISSLLATFFVLFASGCCDAMIVFTAGDDTNYAMLASIHTNVWWCLVIDRCRIDITRPRLVCSVILCKVQVSVYFAWMCGRSDLVVGHTRDTISISIGRRSTLI